jgi:Protein of unknown function (DUF3999)
MEYKKYFVLFALLPAAVFAQAADAPERLDSYTHAATLSTSHNEGLNRVELPLTVYQSVQRNDLADIRVFDNKGVPVPHALAAAEPPRTEKHAPISPPRFPLYVATNGNADSELKIEVRADGALVKIESNKNSKSKQLDKYGYVFDLNQFFDSVSALTFDFNTPPEGYVGKVRIEASDNFKTWRTLVSGAPLMSLQFAGQSIAEKRIELPGAKNKYLKLTWEGPAIELTDVKAEFGDKTSEAERVGVSIAATAGEKSGDYIFDLGARSPVDRIKFALPQINTVAPAQIYSRADDKAQWQNRANATLYRLNFKGNAVASPAVSVPISGDRFWKLVVEQKGGGLGAGMPTMTAEYRPRQLVFVARGEGPFTLGFGKATAKHSSFSVESLIPGYQYGAEFTLAHAQLGDTRTQTVVAASEPTSPEQRKKWLLWGVLIAGVALLGGMAMKLSKQMNKE